MSDQQLPLEQRAPIIAQLKQDLRGEDLVEFGGTANEWAGNLRALKKERDELKTKAAAAVADYPKTPDDYAVELPSDIPPDLFKPEDIKAFKALAHKLKIPQSALKELIDFETGRGVAVRKAYNDAQAEGQKKLKAFLIDTFKDKADATLAGAFRLVEEVGGKELREELEKGQGNNPRLILAFSKLASLFSEKNITMGGGGAASSEGPDLAKIYNKSGGMMGLKPA